MSCVNRKFNCHPEQGENSGIDQDPFSSTRSARQQVAWALGRNHASRLGTYRRLCPRPNPSSRTRRSCPSAPRGTRSRARSATTRSSSSPGATGSGKTTQLPKICLELGRTRIAHTQPRRIAARTIAERIAEELEVPLGTTVGYKVRFTDKVQEDTRVALMTDGILLNEIPPRPAASSL
jgi:hypothetical protein